MASVSSDLETNHRGWMLIADAFGSFDSRSHRTKERPLSKNLPEGSNLSRSTGSFVARYAYGRANGSLSFKSQRSTLAPPVASQRPFGLKAALSTTSPFVPSWIPEWPKSLRALSRPPGESCHTRAAVSAHPVMRSSLFGLKATADVVA
jgi:hypothetical protein